MDLALDTLENKHYEANAFNAKPAPWIAEHRLALQCIQCGAQAFFRKRSVSGQAACFGARPHAEDCELATQTSDEGERAEAVEKFVRENPGGHFDLQLVLPKPAIRNTPVAGLDPTGASGQAGQFTKWWKSQESSSNIGAKQALINLAISAEYRGSTQTVATPKSGGKVAIRDFFIPFKAATSETAGLERGNWGTIFKPVVSGDVTWLNIGTKDQMSILINDAVRADLLAAYSLTDLDDLTGAYVLVVDELKVNKAGTKKYLKPLEARRIAIYFPKEN